MFIIKAQGDDVTNCLFYTSKVVSELLFRYTLPTPRIQPEPIHFCNRAVDGRMKESIQEGIPGS
jgi:hypothetical protein